RNVTGVQTCALPISLYNRVAPFLPPGHNERVAHLSVEDPMTDGDEVPIVRGAGVSPGRAAGPTVRMATAAGEPPRRRTSLSEDEAAQAIVDAADRQSTRL